MLRRFFWGLSIINRICWRHLKTILWLKSYNRFPESVEAWWAAQTEKLIGGSAKPGEVVDSQWRKVISSSLSYRFSMVQKWFSPAVMKDLKDRGDRDGAYARSWDLCRMFRAMAVLFEIRYRRVPSVKKRETKSINTASIQLYSLAMAGFEHRELDVTVLSWSRIEPLWRAQEKFYQGLQYEPLFRFVSAKYKRLHADIWRVCLPTASKSKACNAKTTDDRMHPTCCIRWCFPFAYAVKLLSQGICWR